MATFRYLVTDVDAAIDFYSKLGFLVKERWGPPFAIMERDDIELWLSGPGTSASKAMPDGTLPGPGGWNRLVLKVSDLTSMVGKLKQSGFRFRNEITEGPGGRQILGLDPSGNPVELFESRSTKPSGS